MAEKEFAPNDGKKIIIKTPDGTCYQRFPIKTKVVVKGDNLTEILNECVKPYLQKGDMVYMSEKIVAISQGRSFPIDEIKPSWLAKVLSKCVYKSPYGIGLGSPWTMQLAIMECGPVRIIFCAAIAGICKLFGKRGVFYNMLGARVRAIDGPCHFTLPPYNTHAKLAPAQPNKVAKELTDAMGGCPVIIIDANDIGVNILGKPDKKMDEDKLAAVFKDNPLGQESQQTPIAIVRKISQAEADAALAQAAADAVKEKAEEIKEAASEKAEEESSEQ